MARYRSRSRSYSPRRRSRSPPRDRKRYDDDDDSRDRYHESRSYRDRRSPAPSGLLVRNLPLDARPEDLRTPFERFGPVKDVYLPKNYYTGEPRGFGFVKFRFSEDAIEAKQQLNQTVIGGREIRIVFAEENRKTPQEMRSTSCSSGRSYRRRSPGRSPRRRNRSYSRSPSPARHDSSFISTYSTYLIGALEDSARTGFLSCYRERNRGARGEYYSPARSRSISQSCFPHDKRDYSQSPRPKENGRSSREVNIACSGSRGPRAVSRSLSGSRSRSHSPR